MSKLFFMLVLFCNSSFAQKKLPHLNAHAHNDYEHQRPLKDALDNYFISVEADVHWVEGKLLVAHNLVTVNSPSLEKLYLIPLDSLLKVNNSQIYPGYKNSFYLMIDIKTEGESTYKALKELFSKYPRLLCESESCAVKVFLSGERPINTILKEKYSGLALDGRPEDVGKGYTVNLMPVISDTYKNWSTWNGHSTPTEKELQAIRDLAQRVHAEGKKLRLYAIPDNERTWEILLNAGVDLINTDHLEKLNLFLQRKGL